MILVRRKKEFEVIEIDIWCLSMVSGQNAAESEMREH